MSDGTQPRGGGRPSRHWRDEVGLALVFLTRLPWPGRLPADRPLMDAAWAFPVVGVAVGLVAALGFWVADGLGLPVSIAALVAVGAGILVTGALHEDGLADVADGFGGGRDADAKRRIMRDSRIGSYGVLALILGVAAKVAVLAALPDLETVAAALLTAHALGRAGIPALARWLPPASSRRARPRGRTPGRHRRAVGRRDRHRNRPAAAAGRHRPGGCAVGGGRDARGRLARPAPDRWRHRRRLRRRRTGRRDRRAARRGLLSRRMTTRP